MDYHNIWITTLLICLFGCLPSVAQQAEADSDRPVLLRVEQTPAFYSIAGIAFHLERQLSLASTNYANALALDPPGEPSEEQLSLVLNLAPRLFVTPTEPFKLADIAAIIHPGKPIIAYHLFWEDDIDFPDDNDACDHEVIWVEFEPESKEPLYVYAYFHGRIIRSPLDGFAEKDSRERRPAIAIQWGKHGSLPAGWERSDIQADTGDVEREHFEIDEPISLEAYMRGTYDKLSTVGTRQSDHPLARHWPKRFEGSYEDFTDFSVEYPILDKLETKQLIRVSYWNNATIDQHFLAYNFRPKVEWPTGFEHVSD